MSIFGITTGIICQQTNCQNAYGAGLSGIIAKQYPVVYEKFKENYINNKGNQFGTYELINVEPDLYIANIYSQNYYGNSYKTHIQYTDIDKLISAIDNIAETNKYKQIYIPCCKFKHNIINGIGCGLAGAKWDDIYPRIVELSKRHKSLFLLDTYKHTYSHVE